MAAALPTAKETIKLYIILPITILGENEPILAILISVIAPTIVSTLPMVVSTKSTVRILLEILSFDISGMIIAKELSARITPKIREYKKLSPKTIFASRATTISITIKLMMVSRELSAQVVRICDILMRSPLSNKMTISSILVKTWSTIPKSCDDTILSTGPRIMPSTISGNTSGIPVFTNIAENK
jgi:hypothetical protein